MIDPKKINHKGLRLYWETGSTGKLNSDWVAKLRRILAMLNIAVSPSELDLPGYRWHELSGDRKGTYSLKVNKNWRVTFMWDDKGPYNIDLEDYHGK